MIDEEDDDTDDPVEEYGGGADTPTAMPAAAPTVPTRSTTGSDGVVTNVTDTPVAGTRGRAVTAMPAAQSEPTPQSKKPPLDPRPYALVTKRNPELKQVIDQAAEMTGVSPERIAWHAWKENGRAIGDPTNAPRGGDGEIGLMQILPSTAKELTQNGRLDPHDWRDNVLMAATYMRDLDAKHGKDAFLSVARYNGSGPKAVAYAKSAFPGHAFNEDELTSQGRGGSATPRGLFDAAKKDGPDGFLRYVAETAPSGMPLSDAWRHAEGLLVNAMIRKGDMAGAQHAKDFIFQLSHAGTNQYLMAAHRAMESGDGIGASQYLAKAHAFFPDGTIGRFRSNGKDVYAERIDENDTSRRLGPAMRVTAEGIAGLLNQTTDPQKYLKTLSEQQKTAADIRLKATHGDYYAALMGKIPQDQANKQAELDLGHQRVDAANARTVIQEAGANERNAATNASREKAAAMRSQSGNKSDQTFARMVEKDTATSFDPAMSEDQTPEGKQKLGRIANLYRTLRLNGGLTDPEAKVTAQGIASGDLQVKPSSAGRFGVFDKAGKPISYLPPTTFSQAAAPVPQQQTAMPASPVGAVPTQAMPVFGGVPR